MEKNIKLVAESLQEWEGSQGVQLNEENLNESLSSRWEKLDKENEADVRKFAKRIKKLGASSAIKNIALLIDKANIKSLKKELEKAANDNFKGGFTAMGNSFGYKPLSKIKLKSQTAGGGTQGKFAAGGV